MLCESCSTELMNAHFLLQKAIESHKSLQHTFVQICQISTTEEEKYSNEFEVDPAYFETVFIEQSTDSSFEDNDKKIDIGQTLTEIQNKLQTDEIESEEISQSPGHTLTEIPNTLQTDEIESEEIPQSLIQTLTEIPNKLQTDEIETEEIPQSQLNVITSKPEKTKDNSSKVRRKKSHIMCTHCSKLIAAEYIKLHEETHKEQRERTEMCTKCGIKLYNKKTLYSHMLTHKENREKKHKCEFCEKSYFNRGALNVHRRIHLGQMLSCSICSKEFCRQIDLDKHNYKVHSTSLLHTNVQTPTYYVECKDCGKNVPSRRWKFHRDTHLNKFQMQCTLCDKHFVSKKTCHQHVIRAHKKTKDDFANVVKYYGDNINSRTSHLMIKQTEKVKPTLE